MNVRSLFISDFHLGSRHCKAEALLDLLRRVKAESIYLVGDIIDGWRWRRVWPWPAAHHEVMKELAHHAQACVRITWIIGNHDAFLAPYVSILLGNVSILREAIHIGADDKRYLVTHGDKFDHRNMFMRAISGMFDFPISVKEMARDAAVQGVQGVITGHSHNPGIRYLDGLFLGDCGDFVRNKTALYETHGGRFEILHWT